MRFKDEENQDRDNDFYKISKFDVILITFILFFSVICIFWFMRERFQKSGAPKIVLIYQKDKLLEKVGLGKDKVLTLLNGQMQIEVKGGKVRVAKADCPQHICVNMGWIKYSGQTIVCAPNKVLIELKSTGSPLLDAVAK